MKHIIAALFAITFMWGCTKDVHNTTYSFIVQEGVVALTTEPLNKDGFNTEMNITINEYNAENKIVYNRIDSVVDNKKYVFKAIAVSEYVTVRIDVNAHHDRRGERNYTKYIESAFPLKIGKETKIVFDKSTKTTDKEPKQNGSPFWD